MLTSGALGIGRWGVKSGISCPGTVPVETAELLAKFLEKKKQHFQKLLQLGRISKASDPESLSTPVWFMCTKETNLSDLNVNKFQSLRLI